MDAGKGVGALLAVTILLYGFTDTAYLGYRTKGGVGPNVGYGAEIKAYEESIATGEKPRLQPRGGSGMSGFDA